MQKILVIQQKMIGDVLLSSILCEHLKKQYPNAQVDYLVHTNTIAVVKENPFIDTIIEFTNEFKNNKSHFFKFLKTIRAENYDLVIDAYGKLESNIISFFSRAKQKVSYHKGYTNFVYTKTIKRRPEVLTNAGNALENRLRLIFPENEIEENIIRPKIFLTSKEKNDAKKYLEDNNIDLEKPLIMISVLGSAINKTLPFEYMAKLIDQIVKQTQANVLFNYIPSQKKEAQTVYDLTMPNTQNQIYMHVFGDSLREFLGILYHCNMLIGNEGGAVNMAKALDIGTFTVFSPWIKKEVWNMFEDGVKHDSVHLNDFKPHFYTNVELYKELKDQSHQLYKKFTSELIIPKLKSYLKSHF